MPASKGPEKYRGILFRKGRLDQWQAGAAGRPFHSRLDSRTFANSYIGMDEYRTTANAWGLTGGIGSGKSLAASMLRRLGVPVLDMDRLAAGLMFPGSAVHRDVVLAFGSGVVAADGTIDRKALAALVFSRHDLLRELESIVHPATIAETLRRLEGEALRLAPIVFVESAIVFEAGMNQWLKGVVVVTAPVQTRIRRVMARDNATASEVAGRMAAQLDEPQRLAMADVVWRNDGDTTALRGQIIDTMCLKIRSPGSKTC